MKEKRSTTFYTLGYHKGLWVHIMLRYVPPSCIEEGTIRPIRFVSLDGKPFSSKSSKRSADLAYKRIEKLSKPIVDPEKLSLEEVKDICTNNDIHLSWATQRYKQKEIKIAERQRTNENRAHLPLTSEEFAKFLKALYRSRGGKKYAVIARILWYLNNRLKRGDDYITLDEVLRLKICDVDSEEGVTTCISLSRYTSRGIHMVGHWMPEAIWKPLCEIIREECLYVFCNANGGFLLPDNVNKRFRAAGKKAGINKSVTSMSLRPIRKPMKKRKIRLKKNVFENSKFDEISQQEWKILEKKVPALVQKIGRPSKYSPRAIFNAILFFRQGTQRRKLPNTCPPWRAVDSQLRRWEKKGVIEAVLAARGRIGS